MAFYSTKVTPSSLLQGEASVDSQLPFSAAAVRIGPEGVLPLRLSTLPSPARAQALGLCALVLCSLSAQKRVFKAIYSKTSPYARLLKH